MSDTQIEVTLNQPEEFVETKGPIPVPGEGEALVRVRRIGVCGTDIHAFYGRQPFFTYPRILGHELGVEVVSVKGGNQLKEGDLCCVEPYMNNPDSQASRRGKTNCCEELQCLGVHCDGGMRPWLTVPVHKLHLSRQLNVDQLALVEMLCIGAHAVDRSRVREGEFALVIGAGPIGMSTVQFLQAAGAEVAVMDVNEGRLQFCQDTLNVSKVIQAGEGLDPEMAIRKCGGGDLPTAIFDATGNAASMMANFNFAAHGGRIVFVGLCLDEIHFDDPNFHRRELSLLSSRNATSSDFQRVIAMIESGQVDTSPWITHRMELHDVPQQFRSVVEDSSLRKAVLSL